MTNTISLVTAVHQPSIAYLKDAYESIAAQKMPPRWSWQWVVQEDGQSGAASAVLPDDPRISAGTGTRSGPAATRNMALSRATGSLLRVLDADDMLAPNALARDIAILSHHPQIGWTTSGVLDLLPDGSTVGWEHFNPADGPLAPGDVLSYFQRNTYQLPVHPATLCIRRELAFALGGWMALPAGEDTGLLLAASIVSVGYFIETPGLLYRQHPAQITRQARWTESVEWTARMRVIETRALALRTLWQSNWSTERTERPDQLPGLA